MKPIPLTLVERLEQLATNKEEQTLVDLAPPDCRYFSRLHCNYSASESMLRNQFTKIMKRLSGTFDPGLPLERNQTLKRALRLISAYKILMSPKVSAIFYNAL